MTPAFVNLQFAGVGVGGQPGPRKSYFVIYEFFSRNPGKGEAKAALSLLKAEFNLVEVTDIGHKGDRSYTFWKKMLRQKLIHAVHDANGVIHRNARSM